MKTSSQKQPIRYPRITNGARVWITDAGGKRRRAVVRKVIAPRPGTKWPGKRWAAHLYFRIPGQEFGWDTFRFLSDITPDSRS